VSLPGYAVKDRVNALGGQLRHAAELGVKVGRFLRHVGEGVSLAVNGEEIHVMHLPGHTRCELVVYHPRTRTLFAGDAINEKAGPVTMFGDAKEWRHWVSGLEKLKKLEIERIVPGHGSVCGPEIIDAHIQTIEKRIAGAALEHR
jgi:glyoxylase-like metal-dependent hydrolase (beta-lactamase superfamily II)